jgi:hypothetical protein
MHRTAALTTVLKPDVLTALVANNSRKATERLRYLAPAVPLRAGGGGADDGGSGQAVTMELLGKLLSGGHRNVVAEGAVSLAAIATEPQYLSRMEPTWHPWF